MWRIETMTITRSQMLRICPGVCRENLDSFVADFNRWSAEFGVTTPLRASHFIAQVLHESGSLRYTEEIASGKAYEWRQDLGNIYKGDGVKFKGRGYLQITGRANYQAYAKSKWCKGDLMSHPEWLANSPGNVKASLWFWWKNNISALADKDDVKAVTRKINGGLTGYSQRAYWTRMAKKVMC